MCSSFSGNTRSLQLSQRRVSSVQSRRSTLAPATQAVLTVKESATGVEFPLVQKFWYV